MHPSFGLAKNYWGITLTSIAAKIYNVLLWNSLETKIEKILRKNQNDFQRNRSTTSQILTLSNSWRCMCKKPRGNNIICWLNQGRWLYARREDRANTVRLPKETVAAIMMLYRNMKVKICSPDGDTDYFNVVAGVLQGDTLTPYLFLICLDYVLRTIDKMKDNGFKLTKERSRRYPAQAITDADYANVIALLANTPAQAETLLHCLERAAGGIGLFVNADKMEHVL